MNRLVLVSLLVTATGIAHAEPVDVIATQPLVLAAHGAEVSYDRRITDRFSVLALAGVASAAGGDVSSLTTSVGAELRWWPIHTMRGLYFGLHTSAGHTSMSDQMGSIGGSTGLTERIDAGWRFVAWHHVTIAPALGIGAREDIDDSGRLATTARLVVSLGLEVGWMR